MSTSKKTTRVQMELPETAMQRLKTLKDKTEATSYSDVTRKAYRIYEKMLDLNDAGYAMYLKDKSGNMKEIKFFL
jgi:hypothetical protein